MKIGAKKRLRVLAPTNEITSAPKLEKEEPRIRRRSPRGLTLDSEESIIEKQELNIGREFGQQKRRTRTKKNIRQNCKGREKKSRSPKHQ